MEKSSGRAGALEGKERLPRGLLLTEQQAAGAFVAGAKRALSGRIRETRRVLLHSREHLRPSGIGFRAAAPDERRPPGKNVVKLAKVVVVYRRISPQRRVPVVAVGQLAGEGLNVDQRFGKTATPTWISGPGCVADQCKAG